MLCLLAGGRSSEWRNKATELSVFSCLMRCTIPDYSWFANGVPRVAARSEPPRSSMAQCYSGRKGGNAKEGQTHKRGSCSARERDVIFKCAI